MTPIFSRCIKIDIKNHADTTMNLQTFFLLLTRSKRAKSRKKNCDGRFSFRRRSYPEPFDKLRVTPAPYHFVEASYAQRL